MNSGKTTIDAGVAEKIWQTILASFVIDAFIFPFLSRTDISHAGYLGYLSTSLLGTALILNSNQKLDGLFYNLRSLQSLSSKPGSVYSMLLYAIISVFFLLEIFMRFGGLAMQNFLVLFLALAAAALFIWKAIKEKERHDSLMRNDRKYFIKHLIIQSIMVKLLPAALTRCAAFLALIQICHSDFLYLSVFQYVLALLLFCQTSPASELK